MYKSVVRFLGLLLFVQGLVFANVAASAENAAEFDKLVRTWDRTIEKIDKRVQSGRTGSLEERDLRSQLKAVVDAAVIERDAALKQVKQSQSLLDALGPEPVEGGNPEAETVQKRRKELGQDLTNFDGQAKQADLIIAKADQVASKISLRSRERLKDVLFDRTVTPLNQNAWGIALPEVVQLIDASFIMAPSEWWTNIQNNPEEQMASLRNFSIALVAAIVGLALGTWFRARYGRVPGIKQPSYSRRLLAGLVEGGGRTLGPILFVVLLGMLHLDGGYVQEPLATVVRGIVRDLALFLLGYGLINAALTPRRHDWCLLDFNENASHLLIFRLKLTLGVFLVLDGLHQTTSWVTPSSELASISSFLFTLILAPLLISLLDSRIWGSSAPTEAADTAEATAPKSTISRTRAFLTMGIVALPIAAALGYPGLATYLMRAIVMSGLVLAGLVLLRSLGRESLAVSLDARGRFGRRVRDVFALDREASDRTLFWLRVLFDIGLFVVASVALLPVWGLGVEETTASISKVMRGFQIGSYTLSFVDILFGLMLFGGVIFLTRILQRMLDKHVLPNLTKDKGVRDALKTGVGYIGMIVAGLITVSALGLDLTNLALIAGALSVGLGFGLQNVVSNFVSGLILLAERPIKPGDWVVVGGHEGTVKKVNVRSTEIETFQRASVIIPNADLISTPVVNWTHKNILGRTEIVIGVAYGTDPRLVETILLECARAHPNVMSNPQPFVLFIDFADSSLNFELRAYLSNVEERVRTSSDIRYAIHDALKDKGIEIPFPQRVVHMVAPSS